MALVEKLSIVGMSKTEGWCMTATVVEHERPYHFLTYMVASEFSILITEIESGLTERL